jgi:hypothetical protein
MAAFEKGHKKAGGRAKGVANRATIDLKKVIDRLLPEDELERIWKQNLYSKDPQIAMKVFELALHYCFAKPVRAVVGDELAPPIKIDISAIPTPHVKHESRKRTRWRFLQPAAEATRWRQVSWELLP